MCTNCPSPLSYLGDTQTKAEPPEPNEESGTKWDTIYAVIR